MIAETIQLSLAPAFLLVATGSILNVVTGRLARVVDRARDLLLALEADGASPQPRPRRRLTAAEQKSLFE